jgi:hypothetical protein
VSSGLNFDGGRFALASGQTLKGTGTVVGALGIRADATLAPGGSIGALSTNDVSLTASSAKLLLELDLGTLPDADFLNVTGTVSIANSTLELTLSNAAAFEAKTFLVVANDLSDAITGSFATISPLPIGIVAALDYAYVGTDSLGRVGDGNDLAIIISMVPEARAFLLMGAVGIGIALVSWRRRARHRDDAG